MSAAEPPPDVTQLLNAVCRGDRHAAADLLPVVYDELRQLARHPLANEAPGQTLQATALVHEAYLRLVGQEDQPRWENRAHFFAAAAEAMRRILVEAYRRKKALKHGGASAREALEADRIVAPQPHEDLLALDESLNRLSQLHPRKAELVKLRYFAGLSMAEAVDVLRISTTTADRDWAYARAWLHQDIIGNASPAGPE